MKIDTGQEWLAYGETGQGDVSLVGNGPWGQHGEILLRKGEDNHYDSGPSPCYR